MVGADLQLEAVVGGRGDRLQARIGSDGLLEFGGQTADPIDRAALQAFDLTGHVRRIDELDPVEVRQLLARVVLTPVGRVLLEHSAALGRRGLQNERAGAHHLGLGILDILAEHKDAVIGESARELVVGRLQREGHVRRVVGGHRLDVEILGHRGLGIHESLHGVDDVIGSERAAVAERHPVSERELPHLRVRRLPLRREHRLQGEVGTELDERLESLVLQGDVGHVAGEEGRIEIEVPRLRSDAQGAAGLDGGCGGGRAGAGRPSRPCAADGGGRSGRLRATPRRQSDERHEDAQGC